jgi:peptidoglycan glycosyltransferase
MEPTIPFVLPFEVGHFPVPAYFRDNAPLLAFSSIGLDNVLTNPMHMALVAGSIGNRGIMMQPRLVTEIRDAQGRVVRTFDPQEYGRPITTGSSSQLRQMMLSVTESGGTASSAFAGFPIPVAGKTGTATNGENVPPNAWFVCFAPAGEDDDPRIAVAVIVLDGGDLGNEATGGQVAAPIARDVIAAYLNG